MKLKKLLQEITSAPGGVVADDNEPHWIPSGMTKVLHPRALQGWTQLDFPKADNIVNADEPVIMGVGMRTRITTVGEFETPTSDNFVDAEYYGDITSNDELKNQQTSIEDNIDTVSINPNKEMKKIVKSVEKGNKAISKLQEEKIRTIICEEANKLGILVRESWLSDIVRKVEKKLIDKIDADAEAKKKRLSKDTANKVAAFLEKDNAIEVPHTKLTQKEIDDIADNILKMFSK